MAYKIKHKVETGFGKPIWSIEEAQKKKIENTASKIMKIDNAIWKKYGWKSGSDVKTNIYNTELIKRLNKARIYEVPYIYYHIFEDANFHTLNKGLEETNSFKKGETYAGTEKQYNVYIKKGGKTWEL